MVGPPDKVVSLMVRPPNEVVVAAGFGAETMSAMV